MNTPGQFRLHLEVASGHSFGLPPCLRPVRSYPVSTDLSSIEAPRLQDADLLFVRELSGGIYADAGRDIDSGEDQRTAQDRMVYDEEQIEAVVEVALRHARQRSDRLTSVDKANVLACSRLWRDVVDEQTSTSHRNDVEVEHRLVDSFAMDLVQDPERFDVIVTGNLFGDILSDLAANIKELGMETEGEDIQDAVESDLSGATTLRELAPEVIDLL